LFENIVDILGSNYSFVDLQSVICLTEGQTSASEPSCARGSPFEHDLSVYPLPPTFIDTATYEKGSLLYFHIVDLCIRMNLYFIYIIILGHAVEQLVEALRYKSEGRGFDSRWCHWNFSLI